MRARAGMLHSLGVNASALEDLWTFQVCPQLAHSDPCLQLALAPTAHTLITAFLRLWLALTFNRQFSHVCLHAHSFKIFHVPTARSISPGGDLCGAVVCGRVGTSCVAESGYCIGVGEQRTA